MRQVWEIHLHRGRLVVLLLLQGGGLVLLLHCQLKLLHARLRRKGVRRRERALQLLLGRRRLELGLLVVSGLIMLL